MNIKKTILIFIFLFLVIPVVFSEITDIEITNPSSKYLNKEDSIQFKVTANSYPADIKITSGKDSTGILLSVPNDSTQTIAVSFTEHSSLDDKKIASNKFDHIKISNSEGAVYSTVTVDANPPVNYSQITITPLDNNFENFYSKNIKVNFLAITDETYIDNYILYLVSTSNLNKYKTDFVKKYVDANTVLEKTINSISENIPDGNYYILVDANDAAGNFSSSEQVLLTKQNIYFDNNSPKLISTNLGKISDNNVLYIDVNSFDLNISFEESSGLNNTSEVSIIFPNSKTIDDYNIVNNTISILKEKFILPLANHTIIDGDVFKVSLNVKDNLNNNLLYDFNIVIDSSSPTTPNKNETTIEDVDKNVTITWQKDASTDAGSGLKEYRVYKSTSSFSKITDQTLVCATETNVYSCKDASEKDLDKTYYYGVVGVDYTGNISDANVRSIWSGPECSMTVNDGDKYTKLNEVTIKLRYSNDVNEAAFSCNGSSFSSFVEVNDNEEDTKKFNIVSGNGCSSTNEEKNIYTKVKKENRTSICSSKIYYDSVAPEIPKNIKTQTQENGAVKLTWDISKDVNTSSSVTYKVYYSVLENDVSSTSSFFEVSSTTYTHLLYVDTNVYYKISAVDQAGNESSLSSVAVGLSKKIGADLKISILSSNEFDGNLYIGKGLKKITYTSDQSLSEAPKVSIKINSGSFISIPSTYNNSTKTGECEYDFNVSGKGIIRVSAKNTKGENSVSEIDFNIDVEVPNFEYAVEQEENIFNFSISSYPSDIFRAQYILNKTEEICLKNKDDDSFNCVFDSANTTDGNYMLDILVFDYALNYIKKTINLEIDNVDEDMVLANSLKKELDINLAIIEDNLELFEALDLLKNLDSTLNAKFQIVQLDKSEGDSFFSDLNYSEANKLYLSAKESVTDILSKMPTIEIINSTPTEYLFDENSTFEKGLITDANLINDTFELYKLKNIKIIRNFDIIKIENNKYFSITLVLKNTGSAPKTVTIIEDIPKSFSDTIKHFSFTEQITILNPDPVFSFTTTIPANDEKEITYRFMKPITDVDSVTKYSTINNSFITPVLLDGAVQKEAIYIKKTINKNIFIYLILIIVIFIVILLIINAVVSHKNKTMKFSNDLNSKKEINNYLNTNTDEENNNLNTNTDKKNNTKTQTTAPENTDEKKEDKFQENYDFILSAIKRDK